MMSETRQSGFLLRSLSMRYESGSRLPAHRHDWGQLVYASRGVMTVGTPAGTWVVPPLRAVWIPPGALHRIEMSGAVFMRTLYLAPGLPGLPARLPPTCCVVQVSPLLRELVLHAVALAPLDPAVPEHARLVDFLLDQLETVPTVPLSLPMPGDPRALRVAEALREHPADPRTLAALARSAGASKRTLERVFRRETGLSFGRWRQQLRLLEALRMLAAGRAVTDVALDVGYESPSAFITMFKGALGTTPSRYYNAAEPDREAQRA
jgi:AraC-like DNA-binding protein